MPDVEPPFYKPILYCDQALVVACDGKCSKAWGINRRPKIQLSDNEDDEDDYVWMPDGELGDAPVDPGTTEGFQSKPQHESEMLNKWCIRECERSEMAPTLQEIKLPNFSRLVYNIPLKGFLLVMNAEIVCDVLVALIRKQDAAGVKRLIANPEDLTGLPWLKRVVAYVETGNRDNIEILDPVVRPLAEEVAAVLKGVPNA